MIEKYLRKKELVLANELLAYKAEIRRNDLLECFCLPGRCGSSRRRRRRQIRTDEPEIGTYGVHTWRHRA